MNNFLLKLLLLTKYKNNVDNIYLLLLLLLVVVVVIVQYDSHRVYFIPALIKDCINYFWKSNKINKRGVVVIRTADAK